MKFNSHAPVLALMCALLLPLLACGPSNNQSTGKWQGMISEENGVRVMNNPRNPVYGELELELEEDLRIGGGQDQADLVGAGRLYVDAAGAIYISDPGSHRIQKFGPDGRHLTTFGRKGQGPGEFDRLSAFYPTADGGIYARDGMRIQQFDADGNLLKSTVLTNRISDFIVSPEAFIIGVETRNNQQGRIQALVKFDSDGRAVSDLAEYSDVAAVDQRDEGRIMRVVIVHGYNARLLLAPGPDSSMYTAFPQTYEILRRDWDGAPDLIIRKQETPIPVSKAEKDRIVTRLFDNIVVRNRNIRKDVIRQGCRFPSHRPYFSDMLVDESGRLFILRIRSPLDDDAFRALDMFDAKGRYLRRLIVSIRPQVIRDNRLYELHEDEETGEISIRRFRINNLDSLKSTLQ